jgi:hypothetical protein
MAYLYGCGGKCPRLTFAFALMYGVFVWQGIRQGWQLCCTPRDSRLAAESFHLWVSRVRGHQHTYKVLPIEA